MATRLLIDWVSATAHNPSLLFQYVTHPALHDWDLWQLCNPRNGYNMGAKHDTGTNVFKHTERPDMGKHVIYSGKTIQRIKDMYDVSAFDILKHHIENGHNIARIDLAIDFIETGVTVQKFIDAFEAGHITTRLRSANEVKSLTDKGHTLYIGSQKKRKKLVKIYDKGAETGTGIDWVRVEVQLMGKPATQVSKLVVTDTDIAEVMLRSIKDVLDCPTIRVWNEVFSRKEPIKLQSESDIAGNTREWLDRQVFPALRREISLDAEWWIQYKLGLEG